MTQITKISDNFLYIWSDYPPLSIILTTNMSDQPIIIEDEADVRPQAGKQQINQELFYELLDEVE